MINGCYTFDELKEKYNWTCQEGTIKNQIRYARRRGVEIEVAFKEGRTYFAIINDATEEEWRTYPRNDRYEVTKTGKVRVKGEKNLVGCLTPQGYLVVTDTTRIPNQHYRINRMVLETFNPIENLENYVVDHINGIKTDNRLENLRWLTQRQNIKERDENYANINKNYQKLIEKYGYEGTNRLFEAILNEN